MFLKSLKNFKKEQASTGIPSAACYLCCSSTEIQRDRMVAELNYRFASNLVSIEAYPSGVSAHTSL